MTVKVEAAEQVPCQRLPIRAGFVYGGILAGSVLGLFEAVLMYSRPHYTIFSRRDLGPVIFLAAPLTDLLVFGLAGLVLGHLAEKTSSAGGSHVRWLGAAGMGLAGGFACVVSSQRIWWDKYFSPLLVAFIVIAGGVSVSVISAAVFREWGCRRAGFTSSEIERWVRRLRFGAAALGMVLVGSVAVHEVRGSENISSPPGPLSGAAVRPNIILITLDSAAANHFSCYGYSRATTPNLDALAERGVLFENAIAPSSWTLPSFASIFTGLFPHQHGAEWTSPLPDRLPTLAMALKSAGYQTVGFNANLAYGQASQGIGRGFDLYEDGSENLRQNFPQTLFGRAFMSFVYARFARLDWPERQRAEEINRKVFRWFQHRPRRPYFLFINYFDVHDPYFAPRPFAKRFGELPDGVVRRMHSTIYEAKSSALPQADYDSLVAGYDNTFAYADHEIEALIQFLAKSPDWSNTLVIITSDHGEAFGQHGYFGHGWDLSRELVHVPLMIFGPGIPAGLRVRRVVGTRRLYATILGWAEGRAKGSPAPSSLQNYWSGQQDSDPAPPAVLSELIIRTSELIAPNRIPRRQNAYISLTTERWHWILDARGHMQLFDWVKDPEEKTDLAGSPESNAVVETLQQTLRQGVMATPGPWEGLGYLLPVGLASPPPVKSQGRDLPDSLPFQ